MSSSGPTRPIELNLDRKKHLWIRWADGLESVIPLAKLRAACPCAGCRADREERSRNPLAVVRAVANADDLVTAVNAELQGNYALRILWKDGHDTGIYDFELLRRLGTGETGSDGAQGEQ